jgi:hypothetical protein
VQVVGQHGHQLGEGHSAPLVGPHHLSLVLTLARAVLTAPKYEDHRGIVLQLRQAPHGAAIVGQLEGRWALLH